ncbi:hypothetical protein CEXT_67931 [Caerostris extrusa]|uniref:Uncharacterized protein n=1 Tax=Caerostris extrusa TaxID=172846 RepID=A0AAV4VS59_CAEEX|nr:hypothetical protein CEXT_67931 [Caerostris extrusa]
MRESSSAEHSGRRPPLRAFCASLLRNCNRDDFSGHLINAPAALQDKSWLHFSSSGIIDEKSLCMDSGRKMRGGKGEKKKKKKRIPSGVESNEGKADTDLASERYLK